MSKIVYELIGPMGFSVFNKEFKSEKECEDYHRRTAPVGWVFRSYRIHNGVRQAERTDE